ncbi:MAG: AAA family ATPase [Pseudomonadota bacterium]
MYHQYFGLEEAPFSIAVNPRYLFMSARHRDALAHLLYGVGSGGGFILLTGEVGTGKTTINRCLLEQMPDDTDIAIVLNPALDARELLATVCDELGISLSEEQPSLKTLTDALHAFLLENHSRGRKTVLLIDEAQHLDFDVLEQIRLLTNLETNSEKLLQIILIGQPELAQLLQRPELRQLNQRITARYNLQPLDLDETRAYIRHRLRVAGLAPGRELFPDRVVRALHRRTRGIPRLINLLCDRMLLGAYGRNRERVDPGLLRVAVQEVMGEETNLRGQRAAGPWGLALAGLVCLAGAAYWWSERTPSPVVDTVVLDERAEALPTLPAPPPEPLIERAETPTSDWLQPPAAAFRQLWSLASSVPQPLGECATRTPGKAVCAQSEAETWNDLADFDRPLLLQLITPNRFPAAAVLLALEERDAVLALPEGGVTRLPLVDLAALWSGRYAFIWHPPAGFAKPLQRGDRSAVVAEVAERFAQLDQQTEPLSGEAFNDALETRVRLFQQQQGLRDDGLVGRQTLLRLNELLAIDVTRRVALGRLGAAAQAESMVAR